MKVSSLTNGAILHTLNADDDAAPFFQAAQNLSRTLLKTFDRMGTSIALGESGDLDAAHEYRTKKPG